MFLDEVLWEIYVICLRKDGIVSQLLVQPVKQQVDVLRGCNGLRGLELGVLGVAPSILIVPLAFVVHLEVPKELSNIILKLNLIGSLVMYASRYHSSEGSFMASSGLNAIRVTLRWYSLGAREQSRRDICRK